MNPSHAPARLPAAPGSTQTAPADYTKTQLHVLHTLLYEPGQYHFREGLMRRYEATWSDLLVLDYVVLQRTAGDATIFMNRGIACAARLPGCDESRERAGSRNGGLVMTSCAEPATRPAARRLAGVIRSVEKSTRADAQSIRAVGVNSV